MKRVLVLFMCCMGVTLNLSAQLRVGSNTTLKINGTIGVNGAITNSSAQTDLSSAHVVLTGTNQTLSTSAPLLVQGLTIDGGGTKTTNGDWTVTRDLNFASGIVSIASGKLLYSGTTTLNGSTNSYVAGTLFQRGAGVRFYPIGTASAYLPMSLNDVRDASAEIGATAFAARANLTLPLDVTDIASNRYWQLSVSNGLLGASTASLYVPGATVDASQQLVVVEADDADGATAINLGGGSTGDFVTSFTAIAKPVLTIGVGDKVDIRIHDLISPYNADNINDQLHIVNIEYTAVNKVTLLDRWGLVVKQWSNFRNYDDPVNPNGDTYDFSRLSPGNYICVLEYQLTPDAPKEKLSQMITVLKGN